MYEVPDTQEPLNQGEGIETPKRQQKQPKNPTTPKESKLKEPADNQKEAIVQRISRARADIQAEQIQQAKNYADAVTDSVIALATPLIGLRIIEKGVNALSNGGKASSDFLRCMPSTGITLNASSIYMTDGEDPLQLEAMDDPLIAALMLTGA